MSANSRPRVLLVDDEPNLLAGLSRHLRRDFEVATAEGGPAGVALLRTERPFAVIVSDLRMPEMDGIAFLTQAREIAPDSVRVLLSGNADLQAAISLVNRVNVFRFLQKPCPPEDLIANLEAAVEQHRLVTAERVLLEETLRGSIKALTDLLALVNPMAFGRAQRVRRLVEKVAAHMDVPDRWRLDVAAMLSQVGCIVLPDVAGDRLYTDRPRGETERSMIQRLPRIAADLIASIPRLEEVREILLHQDDPYVPDVPSAVKSSGGAPVGSRILKAALDLDALEQSGLATDVAIATLRSRSGWYAPVVIDSLASCLNAAQLELKIKELALSEVRPGMVLANDVKTRNGLLLIARGQEVTRGLVERLQNSGRGLDTGQRVRVHVPPGVEAAVGETGDLVKAGGAHDAHGSSR
jgi:response regulator RpfG family c-di-GMP phosphodiesterase